VTHHPRSGDSSSSTVTLPRKSAATPSRRRASFQQWNLDAERVRRDSEKLSGAAPNRSCNACRRKQSPAASLQRDSVRPAAMVSCLCDPRLPASSIAELTLAAGATQMSDGNIRPNPLPSPKVRSEPHRAWPTPRPAAVAVQSLSAERAAARERAMAFVSRVERAREKVCASLRGFHDELEG